MRLAKVISAITISTKSSKLFSALLKFEVNKRILTKHLTELLPWFAFKATKMSKYETSEAINQIMIKLFDAPKTQTYYERFNSKRKNFKKVP